MHSPRTIFLVNFLQLYFSTVFLNCTFVWDSVFDYVVHRGYHQGNWINALAEHYWSPTLHNQPSCVLNVFSRSHIFCIQCTPSMFLLIWYQPWLWPWLWLWHFKCCRLNNIRFGEINLNARLNARLEGHTHYISLGRGINEFVSADFSEH